MKLLLCFLSGMLLLTACQPALHKRTPVGDVRYPYQVVLSEPNNPHSVYHRLADSLVHHLLQLTGDTVTVEAAFRDRDDLLGWLQLQFDDPSAGLGLKAASSNRADRTSDEFYVGGVGGSAQYKVCFSVDFRTDSVPREWLDRQLWEKTVALYGLQGMVAREKASFKNGGLFVRTRNGLSDTLYSYSYQIPLDITVFFYPTEKSVPLSASFSLLSTVGVYHQPRISYPVAHLPRQ